MVFITVETRDEGNEAGRRNDAFNIKWEGRTACGRKGSKGLRGMQNEKARPPCVNEDECGFRAGCDSTAVGCH